MLKKLVFVGMILVLMASFSVVLADQDGYTCWCNVDKDGCWVTNEEGGKDYIMFWSEASRKFFMGDSTAPYTNVVSMADGATLGLNCGTPEIVSEANDLESICAAFAAYINKCAGQTVTSTDECIEAFIDYGGAAQAQKNFEEQKAQGCPSDRQPDVN